MNKSNYENKGKLKIDDKCQNNRCITLMEINEDLFAYYISRLHYICKVCEPVFRIFLNSIFEYFLRLLFFIPFFPDFFPFHIFLPLCDLSLVSYPASPSVPSNLARIRTWRPHAIKPQSECYFVCRGKMRCLSARQQAHPADNRSPSPSASEPISGYF